MGSDSKIYETVLPSSRNQRANLDDSGTEAAIMSSSVFNGWFCIICKRNNKHMTHVTLIQIQFRTKLEIPSFLIFQCQTKLGFSSIQITLHITWNKNGHF